MKEADLLVNNKLDIELYALQFKALSDPIRLEVITLLADKGKLCVCDLEEYLKLPQSKLSYHLKRLLNAELIHKEQSATWSYYWINQEKVSNLLSEKICRSLNV